jgi:hypothetical protein
VTSAFQNLQVEFGADIIEVGSGGVQHHYAVIANNGAVPYHYVELNEELLYSWVGISHYDGTDYTELSGQPLPQPFHPGSVTLQLTSVVATSMTLDGGWAAPETYHFTTPTPAYAWGDRMELDVSNIVVDVRYAWAIAW